MRGPNLTLGRRLGLLGGIGSIVAVAGAVMTLGALGRMQDAEHRLSERGEAQRLIRELDTRSSELKVDGYKALMMTAPAEEKAELADDTTKITDRLDALDSLDVAPEDKAQFAALRATFVQYSAGITAVVDAAVANQSAARQRFEDIQKANDATDEAIGALSEDLDADVAQLNQSLLVPRVVSSSAVGCAREWGHGWTCRCPVAAA